MRSKILIYRDYGCADVSSLTEELAFLFADTGISAGFTDAAGISGGALDADVMALFVGGGAGTPFRQKLAGAGNAAIRGYVEQGGVYFGICAGAYYACREIVFEHDVPELCITGGRGIGLYDGRAVGTLRRELGLLPYAKTAFSAAAADIRRPGRTELYKIHYHGGPYFEGDAAAQVFAEYALDVPKAAVVTKMYGNGRVVLSGVHFEDTAQRLSRGMHPLQCDFEPAVRTIAALKACESARLEFSKSLMQLFFQHPLTKRPG